MEVFKWTRADRVKDILFGVALNRGTITYPQLAHQLGMRPDHMAHLLGGVIKESADNGGPLWSALCVSKESQRPLHGFFDYARVLRPEYSGLTDDQVWLLERERCYNEA